MLLGSMFTFVERLACDGIRRKVYRLKHIRSPSWEFKWLHFGPRIANLRTKASHLSLRGVGYGRAALCEHTIRLGPVKWKFSQPMPAFSAVESLVTSMLSCWVRGLDTHGLSGTKRWMSSVETMLQKGERDKFSLIFFRSTRDKN